MGGHVITPLSRKAKTIASTEETSIADLLKTSQTSPVKDLQPKRLGNAGHPQGQPAKAVKKISVPKAASKPSEKPLNGSVSQDFLLDLLPGLNLGISAVSLMPYTLTPMRMPVLALDQSLVHVWHSSASLLKIAAHRSMVACTRE